MDLLKVADKTSSNKVVTVVLSTHRHERDSNSQL